MKGYKVFNSDFTCRDFQFGVGGVYEHDGEVKLCKSGFHFCTNPVDCFTYYPFDPENIVCEVECEDCTESEDDSKRACRKLTVVRQLDWYEVLDLCNMGVGNTGIGNTGNDNSGHRNSGDYNSGDYNSGHRNSGDYNSGYYNSGHRNSGDYNSGHRNSGHRNSGHRNSGDYNSGYYNSGDYNSGYYNSGCRNTGIFNTDEPTVRAFGKDTGLKIGEIDIPYIYLTPTKWVDDKLVTQSYKDAWTEAWAELSDEDKDRFLNLPNFDAEIFEEITGVKV